ncbi:MAG: hypothetical protein GY705_08455 [Bacteroidetes bacterium]|nr:hypothetical protein [Bacteroidota bacterium]
MILGIEISKLLPPIPICLNAWLMMELVIVSTEAIVLLHSANINICAVIAKENIPLFIAEELVPAQQMLPLLR